MKRSSTNEIRPASRVLNTQRKKATKDAKEATWHTEFIKRLPHRVGQPLSSSSGGDGSCSLEQ